MSTEPRADASPVEVFFTEIGPFLLAVDARQVRAIRDSGPVSAAPESPEATVDLARKLDEAAAGWHLPAELFSGVWPRRVLEMATSRGAVALIVGEEVWAGTVASGAIQDVPGLLAGAFQRAGIGRIFLGETNRFGFVVDPEALL